MVATHDAGSLFGHGFLPAVVDFGLHMPLKLLIMETKSDFGMAYQIL